MRQQPSPAPPGRRGRALAPAAQGPSGDVQSKDRDHPLLATRVRLADGRIFVGRISVQRHRRIHLGVLHAGSDGYVELAAGRRPPGGKLHITTRRDRGHFLPGGETGEDGWLSALLELAERHARRGEEVFVAPAVRDDRAANKAYVAHTTWLWIDVDGRDGLPAVRTLLRDKPAHLVVASAGSGGVHCYWRLAEPLQADGDAIERAHERLIFALGYAWENGRPSPTVADGACKDRSRIMRLAGTINGKTGDHAPIVWADLALAPWGLDCLIGDLADAPQPKRASRARPRVSARVNDDDPYKRIAPAAYFRALARIEVPAHGLVSCPNPAHADATPSCSVGEDASEGWCCHGCGAGGAIYDLASVLLGGPTGRWLRGEQFRRARDHVREAYGDREAERYDTSVPNGPTA
ncbi:MAG: hypothetical protein M3401_18815 [Actinomycetota bacterium]|nr:hypothetical protein [Actinomycetota bacterium]